MGDIYVGSEVVTRRDLLPKILFRVIRRFISNAQSDDLRLDFNFATNLLHKDCWMALRLP